MSGKIILRVIPDAPPPIQERINSVIKVLKEEFPDRKIIEIPADIPVEFVD